MVNPKVLITAGCSFSVPNRRSLENYFSWPVHLQEKLNFQECINTAQSAAGNAIISRKVIYNLTQVLKKYKSEEILVGIMWSGRNRLDTYSTNKDFPHNHIENDEFYCNPIKIVNENNFYISSSYWKDEFSKNCIKYYGDDIGQSLYTIEHILRTQWFLKQYNVPYFMTEYNVNCLPRQNEIKTHSDIEYLLKLIDKTQWLPINHMFEYSMSTGIPFVDPMDSHPNTKHHQVFVAEIIIPFLKQKKYIE